jgi:hypothetical protein
MWHNVVFPSITDILAHIKFLFADMKLKLKYVYNKRLFFRKLCKLSNKISRPQTKSFDTTNAAREISEKI